MLTLFFNISIDSLILVCFIQKAIVQSVTEINQSTIIEGRLFCEGSFIICLLTDIRFLGILVISHFISLGASREQH